MAQPLTSKLPATQRDRLHAAFLDGERDYYRLRDGLLETHSGRWVAVHGGRLIAEGDSLFAVMKAVAHCGGHPFIARVGHEEDAAFRVRRAEFPYDFDGPAGLVTFET